MAKLHIITQTHAVNLNILLFYKSIIINKRRNLCIFKFTPEIKMTIKKICIKINPKPFEMPRTYQFCN